VEALRLGRGETLLLRGASGSGKTTLLRLLCGLLVPASGSIRHQVAGAWQELTPATASAWRLQHAGLIFQDFALLDYLSVRDNALLPLRFQNPPPDAWVRAQARLVTLAQRLDLEPKLDQSAAHLSQGERQRVAILRALIQEPSLVIADEPTASLDRTRRDAAMALLSDHCQRTGAGLVIVTHDPELMEQIPRQLDVEALYQPIPS
jgi:putative ABC transport system ATP-binding protein